MTWAKPPIGGMGRVSSSSLEGVTGLDNLEPKLPNSTFEVAKEWLRHRSQLGLDDLGGAFYCGMGFSSFEAVTRLCRLVL